MFRTNKISDRQFVSSVVAVLLLVVTFVLIGFVALSVLMGNSFSFGSQRAAQAPLPQPALAPQASAGTPIAAEMMTYKSSALGFNLKYPGAWHKNEKGLRVIFSPSAAGLNPDNLQNTAIWFGIPASNIVDPAELITHIHADLLPGGQPVKNNTLMAGGQPWQAVQVSFVDTESAAPMIAQIAATSKNEVGYYAVAIAPAEQWAGVEPTFQSMFNSFNFTTEAVLRPTDATPPPTPTATPTPVIYVVKSGDTLLQIALQYGVDVEALAARNGIDDPRSLQTGARLVIPLRRQRFLED